MPAQRRRRLTPGQKVVIALAALISVAFALYLYGGSYLRQRNLALGRAAEVAGEGPPCPAISRAAFEARRLRHFRATRYEDVVFGRQFGHMDCRALRYGGGWWGATYPACQFTGPSLLQVTTDKGEWFFAPGPGQPATVVVQHDAAHCIMASKFTMRTLLGG